MARGNDQRTTRVGLAGSHIRDAPHAECQGRPDAGAAGARDAAERAAARPDAGPQPRRRRRRRVLAGTRRPPSAGAARRPPSATSTRRAVVTLTPRRLTRPAETAKSFAELYAAEMGDRARGQRGWRDQASPERCAIPAAQPISTTYEKPPRRRRGPNCACASRRARRRRAAFIKRDLRESRRVAERHAVAADVAGGPRGARRGPVAAPEQVLRDGARAQLDRDRAAAAEPQLAPRAAADAGGRARVPRQRDCEDAALWKATGASAARSSGSRAGRAPKCVGRALRRRGGAAAGARRGRGPDALRVAAGRLGVRVSGPRFDAHVRGRAPRARVAPAPPRRAGPGRGAARRPARSAARPSSTRRGPGRRGERARARAAAAGPEAAEDEEKGLRGRRARAGAARRRRAVRGARVADLENRLNAVLLDARRASARQGGRDERRGAPVRAMTPDPRPAGALFRGLANEATSPRGLPGTPPPRSAGPGP